MRQIRVATDELAEELQRYLQEKKFIGATYDKEMNIVQFPKEMDQSQLSSLRGTIEKWAESKGCILTDTHTGIWEVVSI